MSRRLFLGVLVTVAAVGALAGASATSADFRGRVNGGEVFDRVASILGIERSELDEAFAQARAEIRNEELDAALAALVEDGTLTAEESEAIAAWLTARPAALEGIKGTVPQPSGFHRGNLGRAPAHSAFGILSISPERLAGLVASGDLSQAEADEIRSWLDARPEAVDKLLPPSLPSPLEGLRGFGGGFFRFDQDGEPFDFDGLRERLDEFHEGLDVPEGGLFQFDDDGFRFEFRGGNPGFFFRGSPGDDGAGPFRGFRGIAPGFFAPPAPETADTPEPANL